MILASILLLKLAPVSRWLAYLLNSLLARLAPYSRLWVYSLQIAQSGRIEAPCPPHRDQRHSYGSLLCKRASCQVVLSKSRDQKSPVQHSHAGSYRRAILQL